MRPARTETKVSGMAPAMQMTPAAVPEYSTGTPPSVSIVQETPMFMWKKMKMRKNRTATRTTKPDWAGTSCIPTSPTSITA